MGLDKEYVIEVVLDIETDTGDTLGLLSYERKETHPTVGAIPSTLKKLSGSHQVPYPRFSSKPVDGKPLFLHTLEGTLGTLSIPTHTETIYHATLLEIKEMTAAEFEKRIENDLRIVPRMSKETMEVGHDFRQDEIREKWSRYFSSLPNRSFSIISLRITCASGTYMRTFAERIAKELGTTGFALSITRTKIGKYQKLGPVGLWTKQY